MDPDCIRTRSSRGAHAGYSTQIVVDDGNGMIVSSDVVAESGDSGQFAQQIERAAETLGKQPDNAVADAGYHNCRELKKVHEQGISVVVPSPLHNSKNPEDRYHREGFVYDREEDVFTTYAKNGIERQYWHVTY